jgi:hypothetical protein
MCGNDAHEKQRSIRAGPVLSVDILAASADDHGPMGDKSPKAKDRNKKQDTANKDQKKAAAVAKATPAVASGKKGR